MRRCRGDEPGPCVSPVGVGRSGRDAEGGRGLRDGQAGEVAELDHFRDPGLDGREPVEGVIERQGLHAVQRVAEAEGGGGLLVLRAQWRAECGEEETGNQWRGAAQGWAGVLCALSDRPAA